MRKVQTLLLLLLVCFVIKNNVFCQEVDALEFLELSLEDQVEIYFDTYRDGHTYFQFASYADYIVSSYGPAVIPYLKEKLKDADFFSVSKNPPREINHNFYENAPNDITLVLIANIWGSLNIYTDPVFHDHVKPYTLDDQEIQWFVDEYKKRIDEYILATNVIDKTVLISEQCIFMIACWSGYYNDISQYGHPQFDITPYYRGRELKEYYEQRLGISDLVIDHEVFEK